ncbi:MAG: hypothetical protein J1E82_06095, partial [Muribaculaceae bacterium]|nr:hypothetical protein [Muribaculaceae bacterium]
FLDSSNSGCTRNSTSELGSALTGTESLNFNSVENVLGSEVQASFSLNPATVLKEDVDIIPTIVDETLSYIPWGDDNQLPYNVIDLIEKDETLATCQVFNAEVSFGSSLRP